MNMRSRLLLGSSVVAALVLLGIWLLGGFDAATGPDLGDLGAGRDGPGTVAGADVAALPPEDGPIDPSVGREGLARGGAEIAGLVVDAATGAPAAGVEVLAFDRHPAFAEVEVRIQDLLRLGFWKQHRSVGPEVLARTTTGPDGRFLLEGLDAGRYFLDARSGAWFSRASIAVRVATDERRDEVELLVSPGGRVAGRVLGPDGEGVPAARVVLRPDANTILSQITNRSFRWFEVDTDEAGGFDIAGVPPGQGYVLTAAATGMAVASSGDLDVTIGLTTRQDLRAGVGATVRGVVRTTDGEPARGAYVAYAYLDLRRVLFSVDGDNPVRADDEGRFELRHVGSGDVAFGAMADGYTVAEPRILRVVDGGVHEVDFEVDEGLKLTGRVVDGDGQPVAKAKVTARGFSRPENDRPDLSLIAKLRSIEAETDAEGRFVVQGLTKGGALLQASRPGYLDGFEFVPQVENHSGDVELLLEVGGFVTGRVVDAEGKPVPRFRVRARPIETLAAQREAARRGAAREADAGQGDEDEEAGGGRGRRDAGDGPDEDQGPRRGMRFDRGEDQGSMSQQERMRQRFRQRMRSSMPARLRGFLNGESLWKRDGEEEVSDAGGRFRVGPFELGRLRVTVTADGYLRSESKEVQLLPDVPQEPLEFVLTKGAVVRGRVVAAGRPVAEAQVTWHRPDDGRRRGPMGLSFDIRPEDFDFLALSTAEGRRSVLTDSQGRFELIGVPEGKVQLRARHPDYAKTNALDVEVPPDTPLEDVVLELRRGGAIEGFVTGLDGKPVRGSMIVALSLQKGVLDSSVTDLRGHYLIQGLAPGTYAVFKTRLDAAVSDLWVGAMNDFRVKATSVREDETVRVDLADRSEDGVDLFGRVLVDGKPSPEAVISLVGQDSGGPFGLGIRSGTSKADGSYELASVPPGQWFVQLQVFIQGRARQASLRIDVPRGLRKHRLDLEFPAGVVSGFVVDARGEPVRGVRLVAVSEAGGESVGGLLGLMAQAGGASRATSGEDGAFRIPRLAPGTWTIRAEPRGRVRDDFATGELRGVEVGPGQEVGGLRLELPSAHVLEGVIVDGTGRPVQGAEVRVWTSRSDLAEAGTGDRQRLSVLLEGLRHRTRSDDEGRFKVRGLIPGSWNLEATKEGLSAVRLDGLEVGIGMAEQRLTMTRGGHVFVKVLELDGSTLPRGRVRVLDSEGRQVGQGKGLASLFVGLFKNRQKDGGSEWLDMGVLPPDTYTLEVESVGDDGEKVVNKVDRVLREGEEARWEVSMKELLRKD